MRPGPPTANEDASAARKPSPTSPALRAASMSTLVATYCLVVLGSTVRVTESGMGCKGWPLCDNQIGPIGSYHTLLEQAHRYLAAGVTLGVVAVAWMAWRSGRRNAVSRAAFACLAIVAVQVVLGAITVLTHNAPPTVALHLATGLLLLGATAVTAVFAFAPAAAGGPGSSRWGGRQAGQRNARRGLLDWSALSLTFLLFISGSVVVDGGASDACRTWPWCSTSAHVAGALQAIQLVHRGLAGVVVLLLTVLAIGMMRRRHDLVAPAFGLALALVVLLAAQVAAGAATALSGAPPAAQDVHLALAAAIWVVVVTLVTVEGSRAPACARSAEPFDQERRGSKRNRRTATKVPTAPQMATTPKSPQAHGEAPGNNWKGANMARMRRPTGK